VPARKGLVTVLASAACFGTLGVLVGLAYAGGARPLALLTWRFALAALLLAAWQAFRDPRSLVPGKGDLLRFAALSVTGYGAGSLCYFYGVREAGASVTTVLLYTYPAIVTLIGRVAYRERVSGMRMAAIAITFGGCVLIAGAGGGGSVSPLGLALGLGAGVFYALFSTLSYRWMGRKPRLVLMTYMFAFSAVLMGLAASASGEGLAVAGWDRMAWIAFGLIVALPTFAAVLLYLRGMSILGPAPAAIISTAEPVFAIALAAVVLGERLSPLQWAGAALVLVGVVLSEAGAKPPEIDGLASV
jgi:drug/metabolite transporter (DMT)-like permease